MTLSIKDEKTRTAFCYALKQANKQQHKHVQPQLFLGLNLLKRWCIYNSLYFSLPPSSQVICALANSKQRWSGICFWDSTRQLPFQGCVQAGIFCRDTPPLALSVQLILKLSLPLSTTISHHSGKRPLNLKLFFFFFIDIKSWNLCFYIYLFT